MVNTYSTLAIIWHLIPWNCYKKAKLERPVQMPCHLSDIKIQTCNFINYRIRSSETVTWGLQGPRSKVKVKGQGQSTFSLELLLHRLGLIRGRQSMHPLLPKSLQILPNQTVLQHFSPFLIHSPKSFHSHKLTCLHPQKNILLFKTCPPLD